MNILDPVPLGYHTARSVLVAGRAAFFGEPEGDLPSGRSAVVQQDDLVPQFGYVGHRYRDFRVLLLGINPGNGPNEAQSPGDAMMFPVLRRFLEQPSTETFAKAQGAYRSVCEAWPLWKRHCSQVIGAGRLSLDDIAYTNCLPWRTQSQSAFSDRVAERAVAIHVEPLIDELKPQVIVAMGKRADQILRISTKRLPEIIVWNRAQAATPSVIADRIATASRILEIVKRNSEGSH